MNGDPEPVGGHVSALAMERWVAGELELPDVRTATEHVVECGACRERYERLMVEDARFIASPQLASRVDSIVVAALREARARTRRRTAGALMACATLAVAFVVMSHHERSRADEPASAARRKGGTSMAIVLQDARGRVATLADGDLARPGDAIRFQVTTGAAADLVVLAFDRRQVSVYAPQPGAGEAVRLEPGRVVTLDGSIVLDDTLGPERVVAVFCAHPRALDELLAEARGAFERAGRDPTRVEHATTCDEVHLDYLKVRR
jgi:hypothetical protein